MLPTRAANSGTQSNLFDLAAVWAFIYLGTTAVFMSKELVGTYASKATSLQRARALLG